MASTCYLFPSGVEEGVDPSSERFAGTFGRTKSQSVKNVEDSHSTQRASSEVDVPRSTYRGTLKVASGQFFADDMVQTGRY